MKILIIADEESKALWDFYTPDKLRGVDLILSCGDLSPDYLQFLVTFGNCPLLYVRGNHDAVYDRNPPDGCISIEGKVYNHEGLRIAGLGGSMRYKDGPDMFTEKEMTSKASKLLRKVRFTNDIDILVTHAPAAGYGDMEDLPHRGFVCFDRIMSEYKPLYMVHGHVHKSYGRGFERTQNHPSGTQIINAYETYMLEVPEGKYPQFGHTGSSMYDLMCSMSAKHRKFSYNPI